MPDVPDPSNAAEADVGARAEPPATLREFERFLRQGGFSQREAKRIAASGFAARAASTQDEQALDQMLAALQRIEQKLTKGTEE